jgi:hypothetical protein
MGIAKSSQVGHQALRSLVGKPVMHAIQELLRGLPDLSRITFVAYRPAPGLDSRLARETDPAVDIRQTAEQLRQEFGIPFWDAILAISMKRGDVPDRYVELAILHDKSPDEYHVDILQSEVSIKKVDSIVRELKEGFSLALSSKVQLKNGEFAHIPMMDFRCPPSLRNGVVVKKALNAMGEEAGFLIDSGRSYHFYGIRLLTQEEWVKFLAMGILFSPIIDARYIAHRLADGACRLRVWTGPHKPSTPTVLEVLG